MFNRIAATRRRAKQRVFESAAGSENLPISDLAAHRASIERLVSLERRVLAVCRSAEGIKAASDAFTGGVETLLSDVGQGAGGDDEDGGLSTAASNGSTPRTAASTPRSDLGSEAGEESALLKDAPRSGSPRESREEEDEMARAVGVLRATAKDCKSSVAHYRSKFQALDEARLDFDAYRRKVARFDKGVMELMERMEHEGWNEGGRAAESRDAKEAKKELDGLYKEQQDKQRKLASATEVFDMKCEIFHEEIALDYEQLKVSVRDAVLLFGAAQTAYAGVIGARVVEGLAPRAEAGAPAAPAPAPAGGACVASFPASPVSDIRAAAAALSAGKPRDEPAETDAHSGAHARSLKLARDSPGRLVSDMERVILEPAATPVAAPEPAAAPPPEPEPELQWGQDTLSSPSLGLAGGAWGDAANPFLSKAE